MKRSIIVAAAAIVLSASGASAQDHSGNLVRPKGQTTITFTPANPMNKARAFFTANELPSGNILVAGGYDGSCNCAPNFADSEIYNSHTGLWTVTTPMNSARAAAVSVRLEGGRVMVIGGFDENFNVLNSAEIYDPKTATWSLTAAMNNARAEDFTTVLLSDGDADETGRKVLVAGGTASDGVTSLSAAEIFDEATNTWTPTGSMNVGRAEFNTVVLHDKRVLAIGGVDSNENAIASAEIYDPVAGTWTLTGSMITARNDLQAVLLRDGRVLVAGGGTGSEDNPRLSSAEIFDPHTGVWTSTGDMTAPRSETELGTVRLRDGLVLVPGGLTSPHTAIASTDLYDPRTGTWSAGGSMSEPRSADATVVLKGNRGALVMGGLDVGSAATASVDIGKTN